MKHRRNLKLQSAMEYLMTYGWAILIIAVVLGALFQLGVFNSTNFAPRVPPGSCRVVRLAGTVNLEGVCSGLPQYAAQFNGQSSSISMGTPPILNPSGGMPSITLSIWVNTALSTSNYQIALMKGGTNAEMDVKPETNVARWGITNTIGTRVVKDTTSGIVTNQWFNLVMTYDGSTIKLYVNGALTDTQAQSGNVGNGGVSSIGFTGNNYWFDGMISNAQIYNTSLSPSDIQTLYIGGIGGAPPFLRNLVGWWPLNGDANDYSGNNNNGAPTNVAYTTSWINGYVPP